MIIVVKLRRHGVGYVKDRYKLTTRFHKKHPNLVLLKYNQITSPFGVKELQRCAYNINFRSRRKWFANAAASWWTWTTTFASSPTPTKSSSITVAVNID